MTQLLKISSSDTVKLLRSKYGERNYVVTPLGEGAWSYAYSFEYDGPKVIRWGNVPDNFERDKYAAQYSAQDLPIPEILEIGTWQNQYYAISSFVSGSFMEQLPTGELNRSLPSILKMFRSLRAIRLSDSQGFGFFNQEGKGSHNSWREFLLDDKDDSAGSLIHGWKDKLKNSSIGSMFYDRLLEEYTALMDFCPEDRGLVHSDLINRNVIAKNDQITAVLDWGSAFFGDPLYDIAWIKFYEPWYPNLKEANLIHFLLKDYLSDPNANTNHLSERLQCYLLNIAAGSLAYNAYKEDWEHAQETITYATSLFP